MTITKPASIWYTREAVCVFFPSISNNCSRYHQLSLFERRCIRMWRPDGIWRTQIAYNQDADIIFLKIDNRFSWTVRTGEGEKDSQNRPRWGCALRQQRHVRHVTKSPTTSWLATLIFQFENNRIQILLESWKLSNSLVVCGNEELRKHAK